MASHTSIRIVALGLIVVAAGVGAYWLSRPESTPPIVGVVRATEVRIAPEVAGQLTAIKVRKGDRVKAGEVVAELSAIELPLQDVASLILRINWKITQYSVPEITIAAGRVNTQAFAILRTVESCNPEPLAAIVPAIPDDKTCVVETGSP